MKSSSPTGLRFREASEDNRKMLEGIDESKLRGRYLDHLRNKEWTVFTPREVDFERFHELLERDPELKFWIEHETDPVLIAERLSRTYPHLFYTIEHVFQIYTDWKIKWTKSHGHQGGGIAPDYLSIPDHLLTTLVDSELHMVARRWFRKHIKELNRNPQKMIAKIEGKIRTETNAKKRGLFKHVRALMRQFVQEKYPAFKTEIVKGKPFPSMHVRLWVKQICERGNAMIVGDVGTQKTSAAIVGLEQLGCRAVIVVCRSYAKNTVWAQEIPRYYKEAMDPYIVRGLEDISALEHMTPKDLRRHRFIIVGYGNLQYGATTRRRGSKKYGDQLVEALLRLKPDGIIIDEAHAIKGRGTRSQRVLRLATAPSVKHRLMLTATPFENNPNEVAHMATLLDPKTYPMPETFLAMCRKNPRIFFGMMSSRMCDYFSQEEVLDLPATNLPPLGFTQIISLPCPQDIREVHDAIQNDGNLEPRQQVNRMTRFLSVPKAAKDWYPHLSGLRCFSDPMANPKLKYLKKEIAERIKKGKVVVASGIFASGITRKLEGVREDPDTYEIAALLKQWFPGNVLVIDGSTGSGHFGGRREIQERWRTDPEARILVASVPATAESLNFISPLIPGSVEKVTVYYLTLPWKPTQALQFNGRFHRSGAEVPMDVFTLAINGTADGALIELNERKWRNFLIGVHGMAIQTEEEHALEETTFRKLTSTPGQWLRDAFRQMMGLGEEGIQKFLGKTLRELPVADTIADYYLKTEDQGTSGQISRVTVPTLTRWHKMGVITSWEDVLDLGCGPLILERKLNAPVFSIDINPKMIEIGRDHSYHAGRNAFEGCASRMPKKWRGKFSMVVASLVLDLTSRRRPKGGGEIERVTILDECHRVLKRGGHLWCTVQSRSFDDESFQAFLEALKPFGFEAVDPWCNRIVAVDHKDHPFTFWSLLLRKRSDIHQVNPPPPLFLQELPKEMQPKPKTPPQPKKSVESEPDLVRHEQFAIRDRNGKLVPIQDATGRIRPKNVPDDYEEIIYYATDDESAP
ncbi:MAG: SNF2-related protein [Patescibacteria group bacterium]|jgi:SAM-dependent methyltransferase